MSESHLFFVSWLSCDAEGVADRSRESEQSFDPRIEERANAKLPEGMPDRAIPNGFTTSRGTRRFLIDFPQIPVERILGLHATLLAVKSSFLASLRDAFN